MPRNFLLISSFLLVAPVVGAEEQTPIAISVNVPSLFFVGSAEKATFLSDLESALSKALGRPVMATFASDLSKMKNDPLWLLDASMAANQSQLVFIQRAQGPNGLAPPLTLYARKKWDSAAALLSKGKLSMLDLGGMEKDLLRYWMLLDEPGAGAITKRMNRARDVRAALTVVAAGEADGAFVPKANYAQLDPRLSSLIEMAELRDMPLPVLGINPVGTLGQQLLAKKEVLARAELPVIPGVITKWKPTGKPEDVRELASVLKEKRSAISRALVMAQLPPLKLSLKPLVPEPPKALPINPSEFLPPQRLQRLPDPPTEAGIAQSP